MSLNTFRTILVVLALLQGLSACSTTHFGTSEAEWASLTEAQRSEVIRAYNEREKLREETRLAEAQRRAKETARQEEQARETARQKRVQAEAIRRGEAGQYGDLIRVSLLGGEMRIGNKHHSFAPLSFTLASGEERAFEVISNDHKYLTYRNEIHLLYDDGLLILTSTPQSGPGEARLIFEPEWRHGKRYILSTNGPLELRGVQVTVMIVPTRPVGP